MTGSALSLLVSIAVAGCVGEASKPEQTGSTEPPAETSTETRLPPLEVDAAFSATEAAIIHDALARWERVALPWTGAGWRVLKATPPSNFAGATDIAARTIWIVPGLLWRGEQQYLTAAMHELGHARGLDHTVAGVMRGGEGRVGADATEFAPEDIAECRRVHACADP